MKTLLTLVYRSLGVGGLVLAFLAVSSCNKPSLEPQKTYTFSVAGTITDQKTGDSLQGINVFLSTFLVCDDFGGQQPSQLYQTTTDANGYYHLHYTTKNRDWQPYVYFNGGISNVPAQVNIPIDTSYHDEVHGPIFYDMPATLNIGLDSIP